MTLDSPLFPPTFTADSERVSLQLREVLASLTSKLAWNSWRLPDNVVVGVKAALATSAQRITTLAPGGVTWARVIRGEKSAAWWQEQAAETQAVMSSVAADLGAALPTWARIRAEVITPTVLEVADKAKAAASFLDAYWPWLLAAVVAGLVGLVVLRVL